MRIMVVDDELNNIGEIKDMIQRSEKSIEAIYFTNPLEALETLKKERFDVAFLDIQMPGINGLEIAEIMTNYNANLDVVFITAYNHYATEAFEVNAIDYILKPIRYERIEKVLKKVLDKKKGEKLYGEKPSFKVLGEVKISYGNKDIKWNRQKNYELFSFLLLYREKRIHKDIICEALWPELDGQRALPNLQVTMCRLRKDLECFSQEQIFIEYNSNSYVLHIPDAWVDIDDFSALIQSDDITSLENAYKLYKGELFSYESWHWAMEAKEYYRRKHEMIFLKIIEHHYINNDFHGVKKLVEDYVILGIPNERISQYYLDAVYQLSNLKDNNQATLLIENWYKKELDMSMPKSIKEYSNK